MEQSAKSHLEYWISEYTKFIEQSEKRIRA